MRKRIFRFDDICVNADMEAAIQFAEHIRMKIPSAQVIFCISPLVHDMASENGITSERIFPKILNSYYQSILKENMERYTKATILSNTRI